jgi:hypothetical protein
MYGLPLVAPCAERAAAYIGVVLQALPGKLVGWGNRQQQIASSPKRVVERLMPC